MKPCSAELAAHFALPVTTTCFLWRLLLRSGEFKGFTDHDRDVFYDGLLYKASAGFTATAIASSAGNNIDDVDINGFLLETGIDGAQIEAGVLDGARVRIVLVNWADLSMGHLPMRGGVLADVQRGGINFSATLHSLSQRMQNTIGRVDTPGCDLKFGTLVPTDGKPPCGKDISALIVTGTVEFANPNRINFTASDVDDSPELPSGYFTNGLVTWLTGANEGQSMEVKSYSNGGLFTLQLAEPFTIEVGDTFEARPGCLKRLVDCQGWDNVINFGGIPDLPGNDAIVSGA